MLSLLATVIAVLGSVGIADRAGAAELGPGFHDPARPLDHLGGYLTPDGTVAYCIEVGRPSTVGGATISGGVVGQVGALPPSEMLRLDSVLALHGQTTDPRTAAAVAMTVWGIADATDYAATGGDAHVLLRAPESERAAISALVDIFRAEASAVAPIVPTADLRLTIAEEDERFGALDVAISPASATTRVTLIGAVFADSGEPVRDGVGGISSLPIRTVAPADNAPYRVSAVTDEVSVGGLPGGAVHLYTTPNAQSLVTAGPPVTATARGSAEDERDRVVPALSTVAQPTAITGGTVSDTATISGLPASGAFLTWTGYLQPATSAAPECTSDTAVLNSSNELLVRSDGVYTSEAFPVRAEHVGIVYWVATLTSVVGETLAEGACGDPTETTAIALPPRLPVVSG